MTRRDVFKGLIAGALSPLLSLLPEREKVKAVGVGLTMSSREPGDNAYLPVDDEWLYVEGSAQIRRRRYGDYFDVWADAQLRNKHTGEVRPYFNYKQSDGAWSGWLRITSQYERGPLPVQKEARNDLG